MKLKGLKERCDMKPRRSMLGLIGLVMVLAVAILAGSCTPWNPLAGAGIGDLKLFWVGDRSAYSADLDSGSFHAIYTDPGFPSWGGIAIDPINKKVYWSDTMSGLLYWADLDGGNRDTIAVSGAAAMAVDPYGGKIYFGGGMDIYRMNLDGSGVQSVYAGGGMINDLKIDPVNEKIYWCDGMVIWSSPLGNPLSPQNVANSANSIERIALDVVGGMIYFTEAGAPVNIRKVSMSGGSPSFVYTTPSSAGGLDVDPGTGRLYWSRPSASTGVYIDSVGVDGGDFRTFVNSPGTGDANRVALFLWP